MRSSSAVIRLLSLLLFLLLVSIVTYWAMQLLAPRGAIAPNDAIGDNNRPPLPIASKLFGARNTETVDTAPPPIDVKVLGVLQAGTRGVAVLGINERPVAAYAVNQKLGNGSVLKAVLDDKVIIDHNGRKIEFPAPARYSLDVLTSNAGNSRLPQGGMPEGIEPAEGSSDGEDGIAGSGAHDPYAGGYAPDGMAPGEGDMGAPADGMMDDGSGQMQGDMQGMNAAGAYPMSPSPGMARPGLDMQDNGGDLPYGGDDANMQDGVAPELEDVMPGGDQLGSLDGLTPEEQAAALNALQQGSGRASSR